MKNLMNRNLNEALTVIGAAGLGMLAMYLFDPEAGKRRRAVATDKIHSAGLNMAHMADVASRDSVNRSRGLFAGLRSRVTPERELSGRRIEERVRARMGRAVSNADALRVQADDDGTVALEGPVLAGEVSQLMAAVWAVHGVKKVDDHLQVHEEPGNVSALQGSEAARPSRLAVDNWPPSVRMLAGSAGIAAAALSVSRGRAIGLLGALLGGALLSRSIENQSLRAMRGLSGAHSVHIDKEMFIAAPPEQVFDFWCHQEDFPRYMRNVQDVHAAGENRWHWKVAGPLRPVEWDAEIVEREENRRLAWRSVPGAAVESEGRVDFEPDGNGTRLRVSMSYAPAAGAAGHLFARLFGKDAKTEMDEDLMRVKSFLETGTPAGIAHAAPTAGTEEASRLH
jgi:uncharacterized membrane protein